VNSHTEVRRVIRLSLLAVAALSAGLRADEPKLSVKAETVAVPAAVAGPVRDLLSSEALVVRGEKGEAVLNLWFRKEIPARATDEQVKNGLTYREIPPGTLVGVVQFPAAFVDFRKQRIPAGVYTLRFVVQPDTGDHTGTAPYPDFCLMSAADKDTTADPLEVKALVELSSEVNGGNHPAVLLLFPNPGKDAGPKLVGKGDGVWVANVRRAVSAGDAKTTLGFGVTVAGTTKE
jgi:hypothetical protein